MSEFSKWLDEEIKELARYKENNMMWAKHAEAIRIREQLKSEIETVSDAICLHYCRYPEAYDDKYRMSQERCSKCPLNGVVK